jgi:hypothetical protein
VQHEAGDGQKSEQSKQSELETCTSRSESVKSAPDPKTTNLAMIQIPQNQSKEGRNELDIWNTNQIFLLNTNKIITDV